ncbi:MAG: 5-aminolevulinate synthase [Proteobacteria bacterium]|nr:5-aminolevulinate synthase [Pseudomonadota bacterium]
MPYDNFFEQELNVLKSEGRYRVFADLERHAHNSPVATWHSANGPKPVVVWCSNDYLGMSHHPSVIEAAVQATKAYGAGSGGTRNISGTAHLHVELERTIADLHEKEAGLVFTSGYVANEAALCTLAKGLPTCVAFCDEKIHASMIQGISHSRVPKHVFSHNNLDELRQQLEQYDKEQPKIIAFVSLYSMEGDFAPIEVICDLAKEYNALTYLDEVHAVGIYGKGGAGLANAFNQQHRIDVIQGNFAKAYGVIGGYITGSKFLVDYVRSLASGFIFTTSLPPMVASAATTSIKILQEADELREKLWDNVNLLKSLLAKTQVNYHHTPSHIVPVVIGDAKACKDFTDALLHDFGIYVQPINYPTVPRGEERLRLTVTPFHTKEMIHDMVNALSCLWGKFFMKMAG